jgi:hypothetical protein
MTGLTCAGSMITIVAIDKASSVFGTRENFIVRLQDNSIVRYFGEQPDVLIAKSFSGIGAGCFRNRHEITTVQFEAGSCISVFGQGALVLCSGLEIFSIPWTVETISEECFEFCGRLREVIFESVSRVSVLGDRAFADCSSLSSICIPSSVTIIGAECFCGCSILNSVSVEHGGRILVIGESAFHGCSTSLLLPSSLAAQ